MHSSTAQPLRLYEAAAGAGQVLGAELPAGDRPDREDDAHQADEDGHIGGRADRERGQVLGADAAHHQRVDGAEHHHGDLADEDGPSQWHEPPNAVDEADAGHGLVRSA